MNLTDKHKAMLITVLISGTIVMGMFTFHLKQQSELITESYYLVEPKTEEELQEEALAKEAAEKQAAETNKAYNETENYKRFAQAYQPIAPPKDYEYTPSENQGDDNNGLNETTSSLPEIDDDVMSSFENVNSVLKKQQNNLSQQSVNKNSTSHYSLLNRTLTFLPTPIYLCETGGKVVVNITVNALGKVTNATINSAASDNNVCLHDHALDYAKDARFSADSSKKTQLGSITFYFEGKR